jgi:trk system potassium uptake protein TrkH
VLLAGGGMSAAAAVRHAAFQAVSVMTTTGFATLDWARLAPAATLTLLGLMFVGACAGSPSGSIKVVRHLTLFRFARRELEQAVHPEAVVPVRLGVALAGLAAGTDVGALTAIGAVAACLGNVGPGLGRAGPFGSYASFDDVSTAILIALMFLGRIEIVPLAVLVGGAYWRA